MSGLGETPRGERTSLAFFGLRNAGKSTLVNAFTGQSISIVSDTPGTTTDPVSKAMEIRPLGPCLVTDTAGLDDSGPLGAARVAKSLAVLETADIAVWVSEDGSDANAELHARFLADCRARHVTVFDYRRGDSVEELKRRIAGVRLDDAPPDLLAGLVTRGARVVCVCPIDESAPKGRLILPQQQVVRACLDYGALCTVCQPREFAEFVAGAQPTDLVITDSQAFGAVAAALEGLSDPPRLTSFSILFARQKGDLRAYSAGLAALARLAGGETILIAEGCTHHRQCNDIGAVKIPKAVRKLTGKDFTFTFASGTDFPTETPPALVIQCGGCMLTRREVLRRIEFCRAAGIPIVNYGMVLAAAAGLDVARCLV